MRCRASPVDYGPVDHVRVSDSGGPCTCRGGFAAGDHSLEAPDSAGLSPAGLSGTRLAVRMAMQCVRELLHYRRV